MKQTILAGTLLLLAFVYVSWRNNGNPASLRANSETARAEKERRLTILENILDGGPSAAPYGGGQPVPRSEYQPCLDSFVSVMGRYGITSDNPPVPIKTMPALTYPITTSESFLCQGFTQWLDSVVKIYDPVGMGTNLTLNLKFGVCTAKFVSDLNQLPALTGRITIFAIPDYKSLAAKTAAKALTGGSPGDSGYELGGLQP